MCEPVSTTTMIMIGISAASAAYGVYQTSENAQRQTNALFKAQAVEDEQRLAQASVDTVERQRQARAERARLRAASAESGAVGISIDEVLDNVDFQSGMDTSLIDQNLDNGRRASSANLQSNLNRVEQPDYLGAALNTGLQITSIYGSDPSVAARNNRSTGP